jgi:hypothetical protein
MIRSFTEEDIKLSGDELKEIAKVAKLLLKGSKKQKKKFFKNMEAFSEMVHSK